MAPIIVHVNQHIIKFNTKHEAALPTLTIKLPGVNARPPALKNAPATIYAHVVKGTGAVVDCHAVGRRPLHCGARVWMEFDPKTFQVEGSWYDFAHLEFNMDLVKQVAGTEA